MTLQGFQQSGRFLMARRHKRARGWIRLWIWKSFQARVLYRIKTLSKHLATRTLVCLHVWRLISCPFGKISQPEPTQGPKKHPHLLGVSGSSFEIYRWNLLSIYNSVITSFKILRNHSWQKCQEVCSMSHTTVTINTVQEDYSKKLPQTIILSIKISHPFSLFQ